MPPKTWRPDPEWPPAPDDWKFWVDGKGHPIRGPVGRYAGPSRRLVFAGAGAVALFLVMGVWMVSTLGVFDGKPPAVQAAQVADDSTPSPTLTPTPTAPTTVPSNPPSAEKTTLTPSTKPTKARTKKTETAESRDPKPTKTTPRPTRTTSTPSARPSTRQELFAEYCRQHNWPAEVCDPDNWSQDPNHP
ncbi:hypothetical protein F1D05_24515 [Kribbella qitaiheensis]|uniref:Uncharacterized protein n=1 Tax=Kribbella qitaiheensis TaxID=1544730 RepID=A0A7G6X2N2_9ACTN|nr:hypothetical protein [Kribbella qitaiheensis]QNE20497.1 hypothetical protein F1D05_24515 [Kribbella qitaiheensis]